LVRDDYHLFSSAGALPKDLIFFPPLNSLCNRSRFTPGEAKMMTNFVGQFHHQSAALVASFFRCVGDTVGVAVSSFTHPGD
jgi:hypothetical protein